MLLTETEYEQHDKARTYKVHPLCARLRELRHATGMSLAQAAHKFGRSAIVMGAYERGDRIPPVTKLVELYEDFGYHLVAVPISDAATVPPRDMAATLRLYAERLEAMGFDPFAESTDEPTGINEAGETLPADDADDAPEQTADAAD